MKINQLRFKNLNSLYGEWLIDFTNPEYTSSGIFALTGPTGAGKSTILDAICLALYGTTPRLGKITKSNNEIMSRQTAECYAEVVFETQTGIFMCHWSQHKARKKLDGSLIDPTHEISDAKTKKPIETKKSLVLKVIEEKTGMDFERFTRSILLAQGGFDNFLKANIEQKSKILEQITGTEIYTKISKRVHECSREEEQKLKILQSGIENITLLEPSKEEELIKAQVKKEKEEQKLNNKIKELDKTLAWLTNIESLKLEIISLLDQSKKLELELKAFAPIEKKLKLALKASKLEGSYTTLSLTRKQQAIESVSLKEKKLELKRIQSKVKEEQLILEKAEKNLETTKIDYKNAIPSIKKLRVHNNHLENQIKLISNCQLEIKAEIKKIPSNPNITVKEQKNSLSKVQEQILINKSNLEKIIDQKLSLHWLTKISYLQKELKDGDPCPVCGSLEHPDKKTKSEHINKSTDKHHELIKETDKLTSSIKALEAKEKSIYSDLIKAEKLEAVINTHKIELDRKGGKLNLLQEELTKIKDKRETLLKEGSFTLECPDKEEERLTKLIPAAEHSERNLKEKYNKTNEKLNIIKNNIYTLNEQISNRASTLDQLEKTFAEDLLSIQFENEITFLNAVLSFTEREKLEIKAKSLQSKQIELSAKKADRENRLIKEEGKDITQSTTQELRPIKVEFENNIEVLNKEIAKIKHQLIENSIAKRNLKEKEAQINLQKKEYLRIKKLQELIGSSDGKKYRNFAQGVTFQFMVSYANTELSKMTDRYLLIPSKNSPLELDVIDNYQAGEIRSIKNLSGGESFIISLTLALGLSKMAGSKVRVDSLFLDEGFGTLDESALETALETLSSLQQDGKLIGIISHISALKEQIGTQINVTPTSGGRSVITGPGCSKLN